MLERLFSVGSFVYSVAVAIVLIFIAVLAVLTYPMGSAIEKMKAE